MRHNSVGSRPRSVGFAGLVAVALVFAVACGEESGGDPPGVSGAGSGERDGSPGPGGDCGSNAADDPCTACLKAKCCNDWKTCRAEGACATCTDCLAREQDPEKCDFASGTCAFMNTSDPTALVLACGLSNCEMECGFG